MKIDNLPVSQLTDKNGMISNEWRNSLQQLISQLQTFSSDEKTLLPLQPSLRTPGQVTEGLNIQSNLGGAYHNTNTNSPNFNLKTYSATDATTYEFTPGTTYHVMDTMDDLNAVPAETRNGKIATVTDGAHDDIAYLGVGNAWRGVTLI